MLRRRLSHRGYEVVLAANGRQGIDMARSEKPDVVPMDLSLPEIDGWQAARIFEERRRHARHSGGGASA